MMLIYADDRGVGFELGSLLGVALLQHSRIDSMSQEEPAAAQKPKSLGLGPYERAMP